MSAFKNLSAFLSAPSYFSPFFLSFMHIFLHNLSFSLALCSYDSSAIMWLLVHYVAELNVGLTQMTGFFPLFSPSTSFSRHLLSFKPWGFALSMKSTQTHTHKLTNTQTYTHQHTNMHTQTHTYIHIYIHKHTNTERDTETETEKERDMERDREPMRKYVVSTF